MNKSRKRTPILLATLIAAVLLLVAGVAYLARMNAGATSLEVRRVPILFSLSPGEKVVGIHPYAGGAVLVTSIMPVLKLIGTRSQDMSYALHCLDLNGKDVASCDLTTDKAPFPSVDSGLSYTEDVGFVWVGAQKVANNKYKRYAVLSAKKGKVPILTEVPGTSIPSALFLREASMLYVLNSEAVPNAILSYHVEDNGFSKERSVEFYNGFVSSVGMARPFRWGGYIGWKPIVGRVLLIDLEHMNIDENEEVLHRFNDAIGSEIQDEGWPLVITDGIVMAERPYGPAELPIKREGRWVAISRARLGIKTPRTNGTNWYREFGATSSGILYRYYRKVDFPTATKLNFTSATPSASGPLVLLDSVSNELLILDAK